MFTGPKLERDADEKDKGGILDKEDLNNNEQPTSIEIQKDGVIMHINDLKNLYHIKVSLDGSLVQNSNREGGNIKKLQKVENLLEQLEEELTNGLGFEEVIKNTERRFRKTGTNIYYTKPEDFQGISVREEREKEISQLKSRGVKTLIVDSIAGTIFEDAKDVADELSIKSTGVEKLSEVDFPIAIYDILDKSGNMMIYEKLEDVPETIIKKVSEGHYNRDY